MLFSLALPGSHSVLWLKKKHIPSGIAVFIVMAGMITILILISAQIGSSVSSFTNELPALQICIKEQISDLVIMLSGKGITGATLSIPITMTMKFALENNEDTRWIAMLLGSEKFHGYSVPRSDKTSAK